MMSQGLEAEWQRVDLLAACLAACRRGTAASEGERARLIDLDRQVAALRSGPSWSTIVKRYGLSPLDQDILSCSVAPEVEPQIGWVFQELQPGVGSQYPTPALLRELLL